MAPPFQSDFTAAELTERRRRLAQAIGAGSLAVIPGLGELATMGLFRQANDFYYLTGGEVPHAYLTISGESGRSILYLPHRDSSRERSEGPSLSFEDGDLVLGATGVEEVKAVESLAVDLGLLTWRPPRPRLLVPMSPAEGSAQSRIEQTAALARAAADPWDGGIGHRQRFAAHLRERFPQLSIEDLSPHVDVLRLVKSNREQELLREAGRLTAEAAAEAMRCTAPGVTEAALAAVAGLLFLLGGARGEGYRAIVAAGTNAWHGHYGRLGSALADGELVLYDYAPDYRYYTSDIGRMWPVSGRFTAGQRALYGFIVDYHRCLLRHIRPGALAGEIMDAAAEEMRAVLDKTQFQEPHHARAAATAIDFRGHLSHPVGMAVHDVGEYRSAPLRPGLVFSVDPMFWIPEDRLYIRCEDTVLITESGCEVLTGAAPLDCDEVEAAMPAEGLLAQIRP